MPNKRRHGRTCLGPSRPPCTGKRPQATKGYRKLDHCSKRWRDYRSRISHCLRSKVSLKSGPRYHKIKHFRHFPTLGKGFTTALLLFGTINSILEKKRAGVSPCPSLPMSVLISR
jgi:hypothetical protein